MFRLAWDDLSVDLIVSRPWNDLLLPQLRRPGTAVSVSPAGSLALSQAETLATSVSAVGRAGCREAAGAENCLFVIERDGKNLRARIGLFDFRLFHHRLFEREILRDVSTTQTGHISPSSAHPDETLFKRENRSFNT